MARASRVPRYMCGCTSTQRSEGGTGICFTRGESIPTVSVKPPNKQGAILSTCAEPLATISPSIANLSNASRGDGFSSRALAATTAATADAADPPKPDPNGMPFSISSSNPKSGVSVSRMTCTARPAVLFCGSTGSGPATPGMERMRTIGSSMRRMRTRSPTASTVCPKISKPMPTLATVAGAKAVTSVSTVYANLEQRAKICGQAQQIRKHACRRHFGSGSGTLHDQRIVAIAACREAHDIVGKRDVGKCVLGVEAHQSDGSIAVGVDSTHIAQHLALGARGNQPGRHRRVGLGQALHELFNAASGESVGHQSFHLHIRHFQGEPHFAAKNDELAGDVQTRQIVARIRFRITPRLGGAHDRGKSLAAVEYIEQKYQGPG